MRALITATKFGLICLAVLLAVMIPSTRDAEASTNPCPSFSIQDVLDDLDGDWDGDRLQNGDEIWVAGLSPCVHDATDFCNQQPHICNARVYYDAVFVPLAQTCVDGKWTYAAVRAFPYNDWDHDGVSNVSEAVNGANPCSKPCPNPTRVDVLLNPWADWDHDGRSNHYEAFGIGTNPCSAPTPAASSGSGIRVVSGSASGNSPAPAPAPSNPSCPQGYPYYSAAHGQCYANPIPGGVRVY